MDEALGPWYEEEEQEGKDDQRQRYVGVGRLACFGTAAAVAAASWPELHARRQLPCLLVWRMSGVRVRGVQALCLLSHVLAWMVLPSY